MFLRHRTCVFLLLFLVLVPQNKGAKTNLTIGYLYATPDIRNVHNQHVNLEGRLISGAMTLACKAVNDANSGLLPNHTLSFIFNDTHTDTLSGTRAVIEQWRQGAVAFIGPEQSCATEARVASSLNLPMISYVRTVFVVYVFF